ncbi:MAG: hypothetical protein ABII97_01145 [Patescibacteria group bacterium]
MSEKEKKQGCGGHCSRGGGGCHGDSSGHNPNSDPDDDGDQCGCGGQCGGHSDPEDQDGEE